MNSRISSRLSPVSWSVYSNKDLNPSSAARTPRPKRRQSGPTIINCYNCGHLPLRWLRMSDDDRFERPFFTVVGTFILSVIMLSAVDRSVGRSIGAWKQLRNVTRKAGQCSDSQPDDGGCVRSCDRLPPLVSSCALTTTTTITTADCSSETDRLYWVKPIRSGDAEC